MRSATLTQKQFTREIRSLRESFQEDTDSLYSMVGLAMDDNVERFKLLTEEQKRVRDRINNLERRDRFDNNARRAYREAFVGYLRGSITPEQRTLLARGETRDMGTGSQPTGGAAFPGSVQGQFVPMGFEAQVESAMAYHSAMIDTATMLDTAIGSPLAYPCDDDIATSASQVAEGAQVSGADIPLTSIIYGAFKYGTLIKMSAELVQDVGFDLEGYLAGVFGRRFSRALQPLFTNGTGSGQPKGITNGITVGATATGSSTNDGGAGTGATSIGSNDLFALEASVDPAYRRGAGYMMHDNTLLAIKQLKDKQGQPLNLWRP